MQLDYTLVDVDYFWSKVDRSGKCWLWTPPPDRYGYGQFVYHYQTFKAHRFAWYLATGNDPGSNHVLHTCDIPNCIRNDICDTYTVRGITFTNYGHLYLATHQFNMYDRWDKHYKIKPHKPTIMIHRKYWIKHWPF